MHETPEPSPWIRRFSAYSAGPVLDMACGSGRHTRMFLDLGMPVTAVDRDTSRLADLTDRGTLDIIETDLEAPQDAWRPPPETFRFVIVANYLWRPLLEPLIAAVAPGGLLLYETFAQGNERFGKPSNPDYLLAPGELLAAVAGKLDVVAYEQGEVATPRPAVVQRICAVNGEPEGRLLA
ncbi:MAG: SAM-dependent methyltransferase [Alphaproteobacteria bacterium]|nr:SAM-dependent methyltransferase [Alphaproteobacteria bacterium]